MEQTLVTMLLTTKLQVAFTITLTYNLVVVLLSTMVK
jgi:hypothetical protein